MTQKNSESCPKCRGTQYWDRVEGRCYGCGFRVHKKWVIPTLSEQTKSTLRTVAAYLSLLVQGIALHFIIKFHPTIVR
jgi:hypothetical protein